MEIKSNDRIGIWGKTGSGKTVLVKKLLYPQYVCRKIFHDIKIENNDIPHTALCRTPQELNKAITEKHFKILYQPKDLDPKDFNHVCKIVFDHGNTLLYVDEAATICTPSQIEEWHFQLLIRGRSRGIGLIHASQRPRAVHNTLISEAEHHFIFRLQLKTDRDKLKQALTDDIINQIGNLPIYHCIYSNLYEQTQILKPLKL